MFRPSHGLQIRTLECVFCLSQMQSADTRLHELISVKPFKSPWRTIVMMKALFSIITMVIIISRRPGI